LNKIKTLSSTLLFFLFFSSSAIAFDAGEHALIGDIGFTQANNNYPNSIKNLETDISFSYGQLIAMSGDMYVSVEEISLDDPGFFNGFFNRNRNSLKKCINKEIEAIRTKEFYTGCDDVDFAKKKIQYVALAHDNYSHFAWHNVKKYIELHTKALWFAKLAYLKCTDAQQKNIKNLCEKKHEQLLDEIAASDYRSKQKSKYRNFPKLFPRKRFTKRYLLEMPKEKMIRLALFTNAFADHYLTDTFSAGHLRVPRSQIDQFVETYEQENKSNKREEGSSVSGALTQYLHNLDGSLTGIPVTNSLGDQFIIRSDKQLFSKENSQRLSGIVEKNEQLRQPTQAVKKSVQEVFSMIDKGNVGTLNAEFSSLKHVPFVVDPKLNSLASRVEQHIAEHGSIKKAIKSMSSEMQVIYRSSMVVEDISYKEYFKHFVKSIPDMMKDLRTQIVSESENETIRKRIPEKLMIALKKLN